MTSELRIEHWNEDVDGILTAENMRRKLQSQVC